MKKIIFLLSSLLVLVYSNTALSFGDEELLPPEQAFSVNARTLDANTVRVEWTIARGYYLYKDRVSVESSTPGIELGETKFPKAKIKFTLRPDGTEGDVEVYYKTLQVDVPINRVKDGITSLALQAKSQGCAEVGVCYPPLNQKVLLNIPAVSATTEKPKAEGLQSLTNFGNSLGLGEPTAQEDFLPPDEAFRLVTEVVDGNTIKASWQIADRYYLYQEKFNIKLVSGDGITLGDVSYSKGEIKDDKILNKTLEVHHHSAEAIIKLNRSNTAAQSVQLQIGYQGCAEAGICYPPQKKTVTHDLPAGSAAPTAVTSTSDTSSGTEDETDTGSFLGNILLAFGIGMLLTFTPCVLPMVPILCSIIVGSGDKQPSKLRCGMLSMSYVMGTAVVYTIMGVLAGLSGAQLQAYFQNAWALGIFAGILVLLSLSMFGFFQIQMPSAIQSRLQSKSQDVQGGSMIGTFIMGTFSAAIVGACVGPLLIAVLGIAIQAGDPVLGGAMMFALAMGMGVFLVMVGVGAGHLLPKAGGWMDNVKYVFGVLLIGVAIYLLTPLQSVPLLLLWGVFFIVVGVYLGATQTLPEGTSGWRYLWKGLGTAILIWGVLSLLGFMQGNRDFMQPVDFSRISVASQGGGTAVSTVDAHDLFVQLKDVAALDAELNKAKAAGKAVILDYYADWCTDCRHMVKSTFSDPSVQQLLNTKFVALQVDVTDPGNEKTEAIKKRFKVFGPPAMLIFDKTGKHRKELDFYGFKSPADLKAVLNQL